MIQQDGGDPAAVMFDAVGAARSRGIDVVLADTAGRLPTQGNLMDELRKIKRVLGKARDGAPDEIWLVLDANTGQNALAQVRAFDAAVGLTGLILTKLDGSAKGGIVAAIARQHPIPLKFIGVGEGLDDLRPFEADEFVDALLAGGGRVAGRCCRRQVTIASIASARIPDRSLRRLRTVGDFCGPSCVPSCSSRRRSRSIPDWIGRELSARLSTPMAEC